MRLETWMIRRVWTVALLAGMAAGVGLHAQEPQKPGGEKAKDEKKQQEKKKPDVPLEPTRKIEFTTDGDRSPTRVSLTATVATICGSRKLTAVSRRN